MAVVLRRSALLGALTRRLCCPGTKDGIRQFSNSNPGDVDEDVEAPEVSMEGDHAETEDEEQPEEPEERPLTEVKYPRKVTSTPFGSVGPGIYKAIAVGTVGQAPVHKHFSNGSSVVIFSVGTGGLRNNRKQYEGEASATYAERSFTQWHRICVFKTGLQGLANTLKKGSQVYVEGNIETRVFSDQGTGLLKRFREICLRQTGRLYIINN